MRSYLETPGLNLRRLVNLPGYSPDFNADETIWGWVREGRRGIRVWEARPWYSREPAISSPA